MCKNDRVHTQKSLKMTKSQLLGVSTRMAVARARQVGSRRGWYRLVAKSLGFNVHCESTGIGSENDSKMAVAVDGENLLFSLPYTWFVIRQVSM